MIDPGHPFSVAFGDLIAALEDRVRNGVERPAVYSFAFQQTVNSYQIPDTIHAVTRVSGLRGGRATVFAENLHYRVSANRLQWVNELEKPDHGKRVDVEYTTREAPPGLTDFNQGSVIGTLLRATAREMSSMYAQMDEAYRRAFIDQASGAGLDNVVALLGVTRTEAQPAVGEVKFFRKTGAGQPIPIAKGTRVSDRSNRIFVTQEAAVILPGARDVKVPVQALVPGIAGNVNAGTITVMPTPPRNVDGVTNDNPTRDGQEAEPDDRLRDRAKHALERAGNATLNAIKFAVLGVEGVEAAEVLDHSLDDGIPLGEVRVRYSGGKREDVFKVVEATRAAGVLAQLDPIQEVFVSGNLYLIPAVPGPTAASVADFLARTVNLIKSLSIGDPLSLRRLGALAFQIPGMAEMAEAKLDFRRRDNTTGPVTDPFFVAKTEIIRPDVAALRAIVLSSLKFQSSALGVDPERLRLTLQVLDSTNAPVLFRNFALDLNVTIRAYSLTAPDDPPVRINAVSKRLEITNSTNGVITILAAEVVLFRPEVHNPDFEFVISCPAFPGLQAITQRIRIIP
jgi:hypothetical protein